jgi:hypothetical protein
VSIDHQAIRDAQAGPRDDPREFFWPNLPTVEIRHSTPLMRRREERAEKWIVQDKSWHDHASCAGMNPNLWFPEKGNTRDAEMAKEICLACPVRDDCLADAMIRGEEFGIWGGVSQRGREQLRRDGRVKPVYGCGTSVGFKTHVERGEDPCANCKRAERTRLRAAEYARQGRYNR